MNTIKISDKRNVKMVAHRGVSGIELENTIGSFIAAGNRSYFGIETDVHKTADGRFVAIHDDETDRVSDQKMPIEASSYDELRKVKLGKTEENSKRIDRRIPNIRDYIGICKTYEKIAVLEIKNHFLREDVKKLLDIIAAEDYIEKTIFISFDFENLVFVREFYPDASVQFLCSQFSDELVARLKEYKMDVDIKYKALDKTAIDKFHENGILVNSWTINDSDKANELISYGIDFVTTNILE